MTPGTGQDAIAVLAEFTSGQRLRRKTAAVEPREKIGGTFLDQVPVAGGVGSKQLFPGGLGVHVVLLFVVGLPRGRDACETAELLRLVPGERAAEVGVALLPENAERFGSFGEGEEAAVLKLRGQNFEKVEVRFLVD